VAASKHTHHTNNISDNINTQQHPTKQHANAQQQQHTNTKQQASSTTTVVPR
jgi:hypothetical protein